MRVVILAGSGLSIPAGYLSTKDLTATVLSGQGVFRHTDGAYYFGSGGDPDGPAAVAMVRRFLNLLEKLVNDYYARVPDRTVNYEDLAYIAGQIADSESAEYDNPALGALHDALRPHIAAILNEGGLDPGDRWNALRLATEARNYIADVAWRGLQRERVADYLGPFVEFVRDRRLEDVSVFTLNHDTLLERTFRAAGLEFVDGFGAPANGVRYWQPEHLGTDRLSRRLVKLHGSVDWFVLRPDHGGFHEERIAQVSGDHEHTCDASDRLQFPVDGRPLLLVGTHNKARGYLNPPFFDTHVEFYRRLNRAAVLLMIGYGGQDKAVNERIVDWMEADLSHRLVVFNRSEGILNQARGALRGFDGGDRLPSKGFPLWRKQRRFELIARPAEEVSAADYMAALRGVPVTRTRRLRFRSRLAATWSWLTVHHAIVGLLTTIAFGTIAAFVSCQVRGITENQLQIQRLAVLPNIAFEVRPSERIAMPNMGAVDLVVFNDGGPVHGLEIQCWTFMPLQLAVHPARDTLVGYVPLSQYFDPFVREERHGDKIIGRLQCSQSSLNRQYAEVHAASVYDAADIWVRPTLPRHLLHLSYTDLVGNRTSRYVMFDEKNSWAVDDRLGNVMRDSLTTRDRSSRRLDLMNMTAETIPACGRALVPAIRTDRKLLSDLGVRL